MKKTIFVVCLFLCVMMVSMVLAETDPWDCPNCGRKGNTDNFCGECGTKAPETWDCPNCGRTGIIDKYCSTCGTKKPESIEIVGPLATTKPLEVGDYVTFGRYPQTSEGTDQTPIGWIVLEVKDRKALLLSKYGLDMKMYNDEYGDITWADSTLRKWLNKSFLNNAFTEEEKRAIMETKVDNSRSQGYSDFDISGGNDTVDLVFLLSYAEANRYLGVMHKNGENVTSRVSPTAYAIARGADIKSEYKTAEGEDAGYWWLRSPGSAQTIACIVDLSGSLNSTFAYILGVSVRPALWVNLESGIF